MKIYRNRENGFIAIVGKHATLSLANGWVAFEDNVAMPKPWVHEPKWPVARAQSLAVNCAIHGGVTSNVGEPLDAFELFFGEPFSTAERKLVEKACERLAKRTIADHVATLPKLGPRILSLVKEGLTDDEVVAKVTNEYFLTDSPLELVLKARARAEKSKGKKKNASADQNAGAFGEAHPKPSKRTRGGPGFVCSDREVVEDPRPRTSGRTVRIRDGAAPGVRGASETTVGPRSKARSDGAELTGDDRRGLPGRGVRDPSKPRVVRVHRRAR